MYGDLIKYFDSPDEVREFPKGRFEVVTVNGTTIGRATYQPGWKWSRDVAPTAKTALCEVEVPSEAEVLPAGPARAAADMGTRPPDHRDDEVPRFDACDRAAGPHDLTERFMSDDQIRRARGWRAVIEPAYLLVGPTYPDVNNTKQHVGVEFELRFWMVINHPDGFLFRKYGDSLHASPSMRRDE